MDALVQDGFVIRGGPLADGHRVVLALEAESETAELISPAGFENYFRDLAPLLDTEEPDAAAIGEVVARYELEIDFDTIPVLAERHGLRLGPA
ncbi:MAG: hypothetical protein H0W16_01555 [Actinobacteria bacterium]|nr:hypothetical protein [Actinomycetota bacterium]